MMYVNQHRRWSCPRRIGGHEFLLIWFHTALSPDLVRHLMAMEHGDELLIADANFPAEARAQKIERRAGVSATGALCACCIAQTAETRHHGNLILQKGIEVPNCPPPGAGLHATRRRDSDAIHQGERRPGLRSDRRRISHCRWSTPPSCAAPSAPNSASRWAAHPASCRQSSLQPPQSPPRARPCTMTPAPRPMRARSYIYRQNNARPDQCRLCTRRGMRHMILPVEPPTGPTGGNIL